MKKVIRYILIILIILNCVLIFNFSAEKSEKSNETSGKVIETIIEINPKTKKMNKDDKQKYKEKIVTPIRKVAHFTIYTSLGCLLYFFNSTLDFEKKQVRRTKRKNKEKTKKIYSIFLSFLLAFIYACTDEIHQLFVPGRSGQIKDICIDSCGALFGIFIALGIMQLFFKVKKQVNCKSKI